MREADKNQNQMSPKLKEYLKEHAQVELDKALANLSFCMARLAASDTRKDLPVIIERNLAKSELMKELLNLTK